MEKSAQPGKLHLWRLPNIGHRWFALVGQLAARRPQIALPRRSPLDWLFPMIGLPSLSVHRRIGHLMAIKAKAELAAKRGG